MNIHYYNVLGFDNNKPTIEEIKTAYRSLTKTCHPDIFPDDPAKEQEFKNITEAYEVLSDIDKRRVYDQHGYNEVDSEEKLYQEAEREFINLFEQVFSQIPDHALYQVNLKQIMVQTLEENRVAHKQDISNVYRQIQRLKIPLGKMKSKTKKNLIVNFLNQKILEMHKAIDRKHRIIRILGIMRTISEDYNYELGANFLISNTTNSTTNSGPMFFRS